MKTENDYEKKMEIVDYPNRVKRRANRVEPSQEKKDAFFAACKAILENNKKYEQ